MKIDELIFGCGRLRGGTEEANSRKLIELALDQGIRRFDVAPSYGLGSAESILGAVLAESGISREVKITTKYGIPAPASPSLMLVARRAAKSIVRLVPSLREVAIRAANTNQGKREIRPDCLIPSIEASLARLKVSTLDGLLLHEPTVESITPILIQRLDSATKSGLIAKYGSGTGKPYDGLVHCGTIEQFCFSSGTRPPSPSTGLRRVVHGCIRGRPTEEGLNDGEYALRCLTSGLQEMSANQVIFSTTSVARLHNLLTAVKNGNT